MRLQEEIDKITLRLIKMKDLNLGLEFLKIAAHKEVQKKMVSPDMQDADIINLKNVVCVYCHQVMGKQGEVRITDPKTGRVNLQVVMEDALDLPEFCQQSPNGKHANMTPEQALAQGFI